MSLAEETKRWQQENLSLRRPDKECEMLEAKFAQLASHKARRLWLLRHYKQALRVGRLDTWVYPFERELFDDYNIK